MKSIDKFVLLFLAIKFLTACTTIKKGKVPGHTGFLISPQLLTSGKPGQAQWIYFKPGVDWVSYVKV